MPTINGEKYACQSCVRGHRVSTCYHNDRELKLIPPKGRPVKQCDHCRTARKSKSHHGKCDCGSRKDKKDQDPSADLKSECCCQDGKLCRCSTRSETVEIRMERSLKRPTLPVKSKPAFTKSQSEDKLLHVVNGHHKPCHRNNNAAHTLGQPYTIPRPHSHHGHSHAAQQLKTQAEDSVQPTLANAVVHNAATILELADENIADEIISYDFDKHFASSGQARVSNSLPQASLGGNGEYGCDWTQSSALMTTNNLMGLSVDTSPNFGTEIGYQHFSPEDLPLISPQVTNFNQTISHSSDFTNESAWTVENYMMDGQVAVQDSWPDANRALLEDVLKTSNYGEMSQFAGNTQTAYQSMSAAYNDAQSQSPTKTEHVNNSMIIPAESESSEEEAVEGWWPQNTFTAQASSSTSMPGMPSTLPSVAQSHSQSTDITTYEGNYDWLY